MASLVDVFTEKERTNWLKAWLAMDIAKSGLDNFAETEAKTIHANIYNAVWSSVQEQVVCTCCQTANLLKCPTPGICNKRGANRLCTSMHDTAAKQPRPCPTNVCNKVLDEIRKLHTFSSPSWTNTRAEQWAQNPWQIAKAYLPPDGDTGKSSVKDTGFNGIISFMINCKHFDGKFSFPICSGKHMSACLLTKARDIGRTVRHSSQCQLTDSDLQVIFTTLTDLLTDPTCLAHNVASQEAVKKLAELQHDVLKITTEEIIHLQDAVQDKLKKDVQDRTNWLKAWLAVDIAKSGLDNFAEAEAKTVHANIYNAVWSSVQAPAVCTSCHTANLLKCPTPGICFKRGANSSCKAMHDTEAKQPRPCPNNVCNKVLDEIRKLHTFSRPSWTNTRAEQWAQNPWQIAKAYLPPDGYTGKNSVQDTDFNGIISFMINCKHFDSKFSFAIASEKHNPPCLLTKARNISNIVRHLPQCQLTDSALQDIFTTLTNLLTDPTCLAHNVASQEAVKKLAELQHDRLKITTQEIIHSQDAVQDKLKKDVQDNLEEVVQNKVKDVVKDKVEEVDYIAEKPPLAIKVYLENCWDSLKVYTVGKCEGALDGRLKQLKEELNELLEKCEEKFYAHKEKLDELNEKLKNALDGYSRTPAESYYEQLCEVVDLHETYDFLPNTWTDVDLTNTRNILRTTERRHEERIPLPSIPSCTREYLRDLSSTHGRKSEQLKSECKTICERILCVYGVVDVYPAFHDDDQTHVVFVVAHTGENIKQDMEKAFNGSDEIDYVTKAVGCFQSCNEAELVDIPEEYQQRLRVCIREISKGLYVKHKRLSFIEGCTINFNGTYEPRILLYVHAKGYIPIDEDPFDKFYEGIRVSVREGSFVQLMNHSYQMHENVRMGCSIERKCEFKGTLGVFFKHSTYGLCSITCAHVLMDEHELGSVIGNNGNVQLVVDDYIVFQPEKPYDIGIVREIFVKQHVDDKSGIEIAIIQLQKRHPVCGRFPAPENPPDYDYEFTSGRVLDKENLRGKCWKFGGVTEYTSGEILQSLNSCVIRNPITKDPIYELYDQIVVRSSDANKPFAVHGDSGGPVFLDDCSGEVFCIGLIEGAILDSKRTLVTPIGSIMRVVNASSLQSFVPRKNML